jgi:hypothetical protein
MKKLLIISVLCLLSLGSLSRVYADTGLVAPAVPSGATGAPPTTPAVSDQQRLSNLNTTKTTLEEGIKADEKTIADLKSSGTEADLQTAAGLQSSLDTKKASLEAVNKNIRIVNKTIEFDNLLNGNETKGKQILKELAACEKIDCPKKEILTLRQNANAAYGKFLNLKKLFEICKLETECKTDTEGLGILEVLLKSANEEVIKILRAITVIETKLNREQTFDVSDIFSTKNNDPNVNEVEPKGFQSVVNTLANWMITLVASLAVTTLIIGGFLMIISGGDESRLETGKTIFTYSLIGIIVTLMAFGIISFIQSLFYA